MIKIARNTLILVDGSSYLYRAYHAFPTLTNSVGEPTGAIYGMLNMLNSLLVHYRPSHVAVVFDAQGKTFRDELFESYKSNRPPMPKNLCVQITQLYKIVTAMGLPLLAISGVEADDVIGTLALAAARDGSDVLISTSDKDMAQLVSPKITLIDTMSNTILGPKEVQMKFGVPPELIIDYLALMGDRSDNIPGVPNVGVKTAQALLNGLGGLTRLYQQLDNIRNLSFRGAKNMATKLEQHRDVAFLSYQLATIKTDVVLDVSYDILTVKEPDVEALLLLCQRYEFKSWVRYLESDNWLMRKKTVVPPSSFTVLRDTVNEELAETTLRKGYHIIYDMAALESWITNMRSACLFAFNIETDRRDPLTANLVGICFSVNPGEAAYLPVGHDYLDAPDQLDRVQVLTALKPLFEDLSITKIGHNLKFDQSVLTSYEIELAGNTYDTMLESYVFDSVAGNQTIASLAGRLLQLTTVSFEKIAGKGKNQLTFNQIAIEQAAHYVTNKTDITLRLHQKLWPNIEQEPLLKRVFKEIEMPLVPVLSRIERIGVLIEQSVLTNHSLKLARRLKELEAQVYILANESFNLSSTKQLQTILYDRQKMPVLQKTPGGAPSTNELVLSKLALDYPLPKLILEYRGLAKLKSSYTDKLPKMIHPQSKRVHTSYHQAITTTGRLSSSNPNLQNIPVRNKDGRQIRRAFVAPPDSLIVVADYSQIELRIMAYLSRDTSLLDAFATGKDIHCATAAEVFGTPLDKITTEQRRNAKTINFGLIYGISAFGLARQLPGKLLEAQKYINLYFERYPGILEYIKRTCKQASDQGYVATLYGRRIYLPDINSSNIKRKRAAERAAINAPIQGTAADIIKRSMIAIDAWLQKEKQSVRMIMQVHDELIFQVQRGAIESTKNKIKKLMEGCVSLDISLRVDISEGENWDQAH
ncbi:DNA polymerase I [Candidatus Hoaglandella endobia]|uniref:DNA polymerase I n=1 Tax=Candidatus Hoaglandella endobia TaxID=1778263 RepID=UPI00082F92C8|nr:DNA polymerase I [Candidatus Hoaglandella endobia]